MKNQKKIMIVLVFLLILAVAYIGFSKYNDWKQGRDIGIFQQGAQYGYEQAIVQVVQKAVSCETVPLRVENQTINMIAVDCLQKPALPSQEANK